MKNILLDTDIGGDCDDAGALVMLKSLAERGDIRLLGATSCTTMEGAEHTIEAILRHYGMSVPIGVMREPPFMCGGDFNRYARGVKACFPSEPKVCGAVELMRKTLANSEEKCTLIAIGPQRNLARFLASPKDEYSSLGGADLAREKLEELVIMGGTFLYGKNCAVFEGKRIVREWNIEQDIAAARFVAKNCPVDIVYCPFETGYDVETGKNLPEGSPARLCYDIRSGKTRASWDPCAVYYGALGCEDLFSLSGRGTVTFDRRGKSVFRKSRGGTHRILRCAASKERIEKAIDDLMR